MRKLVSLCMILFSSLFISITYAQQYRDVVYLKNGSIIKGMITEQIPSQSLKIETGDGSTFIYEMDQVSRITKEEVLENPSNPYSANQQMDQQMNDYSNRIYSARRLEPGLSFLFSFLVPGVGQMYNGQVGRGIGMLLGTYGLVGIGSVIGTNFNPGVGSIMILGGVGIYFWSFIDAPIAASRINRANGIVLGKDVRLNICPDINYGPQMVNTLDNTQSVSYGMKFHLSF